MLLKLIKKSQKFGMRFSIHRNYFKEESKQYGKTL